MRILLVKTSSLGDVIHNLPVVSDILAHHPDAAIDWCVEDSFADIPRLHPGVATVHRVAIRRWRKHPFTADTRQQFRQFREALTRQPYDLILDTQGLLKSALVACLARGESNKEIARALDLAESTVKIHIQNIFKKLNLTSRVQAAVYAVENGFGQGD